MRAVLAYSGGLDTSICVKILQEKYDCDVVTVLVDVGIIGEKLKDAEKRAEELGAVKHHTLDGKVEFAEKFVFKAIKANALYEGYPLSTALARPLIALKCVEIARKEKADALAHGATGKGNDQFRFESVFRSKAPDMKIIAPVRELNLTRKEGIAYARKKDVPVRVDADEPFSIDENLWGRSIEGGILEDPAVEPPEDIFEWTEVKEDKPGTVEIEFEHGVPTALNGKKLAPVDLIIEMNRLAGSHGIGRIDIMEDRILGMKTREIYEAPAAISLITAHKQLEQLVLTRSELKFKESVDAVWGELVYLGLWSEPLRKDLEAFIDKTQQRVCGSVKLKMYTGSCMVTARDSKYALYSPESSFDDKSIDQRDAEGMLKYHSLQARLYEGGKKQD